MTKDQYAAQLAKEMRKGGVKFNHSDARKFVTALTKSLTEGLIHDRKIVLSNFGTFCVAKYGSKIIQSPRADKKKFFMPPTDVIKWLPSEKIRNRAGSFRISDSEFEKLKGHPQEELEEMIPTPPVEQLTRKTPYDVQIKVVQTGRERFFTDELSPISRLSRSILREMLNSGAEKVEIRPGKKNSNLNYLAQNQLLFSQNIPKISHRIIIEKLKSLAVNEPNLLPDEKIILMPENRKIKLYSILTPFGELLVLERFSV